MLMSSRPHLGSVCLHTDTQMQINLRRPRRRDITDEEMFGM